MQTTDSSRRVAFPAFVVVLVLLVTGACGGHPPPPPAASQEASNSGGASAADGGGLQGSADTTPDGGGASATTSAGDAGSGSTDLIATKTTSSTQTEDADDACSKAGSGFEKRARPAIKACYREGKKTDPALVGGVRIVVNVTSAGKVGNVISSPNGDKAMLPPAVVKCMVDAVKKNDPAGLDKCPGKTVVMPVQFPSQ
jgi:hypothetical protein